MPRLKAEFADGEITVIHNGLTESECEALRDLVVESITKGVKRVDLGAAIERIRAEMGKQE